MIDDAIKMRGVLELRLEREDGSIETTTVENLVVNIGKHVIAARMLAAPVDGPMSHIGVGTNGTVPAATDTVLNAEIMRSAITSATVTGAVISYLTTMGPGIGTGSLAEAGIFNAVALGSMLARTTFAPINKGASDTLQITWTVTVG